MSGRPRVKGWRLVTLAAFVAAGVLFVTSGLASHGLDLRASSVTDLDTVLRHERSRVDAMQAHVARLNGEVGDLTREAGSARVDKLQARLDRLKGASGFRAMHGPGVRVTLDDAPKSVVRRARADGSMSADMLVVHQQDIQAVVNALWHGGADAVTIEGQRLISTSGIKCVGNTVVLHGVPYSPPYDIAAIGDPAALTRSLASSEYVAAYQTFVEQYHLGWKLDTDADLSMPAYIGTPDLRYAGPAAPARPGAK